MDAATLSALFQPFVHAEAMTRRNAAGLGLGLALSKYTVELHGGTVQGSSSGPGKGAAFVVELPLLRTNVVGAPMSRPTARPNRQLRILLIDDDEDAALTLRDLLELEHQEVLVAPDAETGIPAALAHRPDVVLCDVGLPGIDGYEVARQLSAAGCGAVLVALTGHASAEDVQLAWQAGFHHHLAKPVELSTLLDLLATVDREHLGGMYQHAQKPNGEPGGTPNGGLDRSPRIGVSPARPGHAIVVRICCASPVTHALSVFLRNHRDDIVQSWETLVLSESRVVDLGGVVLRNSIPQLLDELADWLQSGEPPAGAAVGKQALAHVVQRLDEGLDLAQVLREYRLLRESILRAVLEAEAAEQARAGVAGERDRAARVVELARLNAGLDVAFSDSVAEFVAERDRRIAFERDRAAVLSEALGAIDLAIHSSHELGHIVQTALQQATTALGTETAALSLREGAAWIVRYVHGLAPEAIGTRMVDDEEPHAVLALREQRPVAIPDAWNDVRVNQEHMRRWNVRAVMVVPLIVRGEPTGVVFFNDHRGPRALGRAELDFGAKFGAALSLAIENAHLFAELREVDRRKTEFLAVLSHELRNPLAPIRNSIALLDSAPSDSAIARRAKDILRRQSDHLVRLVNDLLDLSRITHGKMHVELMPTDARELVRRAYVDAKVLFDARGIELTLSDSAEPIWIEADPARFSQMLGNLLQNALKFTPPRGLVQLEVEHEGGACRVTVKDNGQGLDPADFDRIFDPFEQAARTREGATGLGLGLALVKRLAVKHHGTVRVHSDGVGYGAEFVLEFPVIAAPAPERVSPAPLHQKRTTPMTILVVEDNEDAAATLADLLSLGGHRVSTASTGEAAVHAMAAQPPNVVICDVGLPDMSGYDLIRAIRSRENGNRVFAVALTGYAHSQDQDEALAAGFDAHLPKPAPLDKLDALLAQAEARRTSPAA